jgi:hypothetical protein
MQLDLPLFDRQNGADVAAVAAPASAQTATAPVIFNSADSKATATLRGNILRLQHISGEPGSEEDIGVLLPQASTTSKVLVNGTPAEFVATGEYVSIHLRFAGLPFGHAQQLKLGAADSKKMLEGSFVIPQRVMSQLSARRRRWPIPWSSKDYETTWLVPERLLLFVQIAGASDEEQPHVIVDGQPVILKRAYSSVRVHSAAFVGFYVDMSNTAADVEHTLQIDLSELSEGVFQGVFFDNVEPERNRGNWHSGRP